MVRNQKRPSGRFFLIDNKIFEYGLLPKELAVYCYLIKCSDKKQQSFPSRRNIKKNCNISLPVVDSAIKGLVDKGLLEITHRYDPDTGNKRSNLYTVTNLL